jgi:hypothetical protein
MKLAIAIASAALAAGSMAGIAACGGSSPSSSAASCNAKISGNGSSVYLTLTNPNGSISSSDCNSMVNGSGNVSGVTTAIVSSVPSGLSTSCSGTHQGDNYKVYSDGTAEGGAFATAVCSSLGS